MNVALRAASSYRFLVTYRGGGGEGAKIGYTSRLIMNKVNLFNSLNNILKCSIVLL